MIKRKDLFWGLIMAILLFPMVFQLSSGTIVHPLKGWQPPPKEVDLQWSNIKQGKWQDQKEAAAKYFLQARHFLIRLNNQLKYSLFGKLNSKDVIQGKEGYLFEERYIRTHLGLDFLGDESIRENVEMIKGFTDSLKRNDAELLFVFASGKGMFMPEYFPEKYQNHPKKTNNYETYLKYIKQYEVPYLDLNQYLVDLKDTAAYGLYTKGNTHWSEYALTYVLDTLFITIEKQLDIDLLDYSYDSVEIAPKARGLDAGIFKALNLYWTQLEEQYAYRAINIKEDEVLQKNKPKIWIIGDSFFGTLFNDYLPQRFFDPSSKFLYYFQQIWTFDGQKYPTTNLEDLRGSVEEQDMIIVFITDANLGSCCWGMTGVFYRMYHPEN